MNLSRFSRRRIGQDPAPFTPGVPNEQTGRRPAASERRLFVIGAARSGTTVLQNALNSSPHIFLLGEPDLQGEGDRQGFAARYNAMHRGWGNQETKSTFRPPVLVDDRAWRDHCAALAGTYAWVGAKLVINPIREADGLETLFGFFCREFYRAYYIFAFRPPLATVCSTRDLQHLKRGEHDSLFSIMLSFTDVVRLYIRMLRNLPNVRAVFHDAMSRRAFEGLESWLGEPLPEAHLYYDPLRTRAYDDAGFDSVERKSLSLLCELYDDLRQSADQTFQAAQMEQNDNHINPAHHTLLGSIDRRARLIAADLAEKARLAGKPGSRVRDDD